MGTLFFLGLAPYCAHLTAFHALSYMEGESSHGSITGISRKATVGNENAARKNCNFLDKDDVEGYIANL